MIKNEYDENFRQPSEYLPKIEKKQMGVKMKSVFDGVPIMEMGLPIQSICSEPIKLQIQEIVGHCPVCGAPIYGPKKIAEGVEPAVRHSCGCRPLSAFDQTIQTK